MSSQAFQTWPSEDSQNDDLRQQIEQAIAERDVARKESSALARQLDFAQEALEKVFSIATDSEQYKGIDRLGLISDYAWAGLNGKAKP